MIQRELATAQEIRRAAMDFLARREHSRWELRQKLEKRGAGCSLDLVLDRLEQDDLLSDRRYCEARVRYRAAKGFGPIKIREELQRCGVSEALISACLYSNDDQWFPVICRLVERKYAGSKIRDTKSKATQQRFLLQRGFTYDQIRHALNDELA